MKAKTKTELYLIEAHLVHFSELRIKNDEKNESYELKV